MLGTTNKLVIATFPTPFSGEAASYELGLHRIAERARGPWQTEWIQIHGSDPKASARDVLDVDPDLIIVHAHRTQVVDTIAFINAVAERAPDRVVIWCGWTAHPPYIDATCADFEELEHPSLAVACGEIEEVVYEVLEHVAGGRPRIDDVDGRESLTVWSPATRRWSGPQQFAIVQDAAGLPVCAIEHIPKDIDGVPAGWVEISRGCRYRCTFCIADGYGKSGFRPRDPDKIRAEARLVVERGAEVLGLLSASNSFNIDGLRAVVDALRAMGRIDDVKVAGPVHARFLDDERLELLSSMKWDLMTIGLQSITPEAQRMAGRHDEPQAFARAMERVSRFVSPEVELVLGLPGDSPEGFRATLDYVLQLPVNITVHTLRLDPWSTLLLRRQELGIEADFRAVAQIRSSPEFSAEALAECEAWLRRLGNGPWPHRARRLTLDCEQLH